MKTFARQFADPFEDSADSSPQFLGPLDADPGPLLRLNFNDALPMSRRNAADRILAHPVMREAMGARVGASEITGDDEEGALSAALARLKPDPRSDADYQDFLKSVQRRPSGAEASPAGQDLLRHSEDIQGRYDKAAETESRLKQIQRRKQLVAEARQAVEGNASPMALSDELTRQARGARQDGRLDDAYAIEEELKSMPPPVSRLQQKRQAREAERRAVAMKYGRDPVEDDSKRDYFPAPPPGPSSMAIGNPAGVDQADALGILGEAPINPNGPPASGGRLVLDDADLGAAGMGGGASAGEWDLRSGPPREALNEFAPRDAWERQAAFRAEMDLSRKLQDQLRSLDPSDPNIAPKRGRLVRAAEAQRAQARADAVYKERVRRAGKPGGEASKLEKRRGQLERRLKGAEKKLEEFEKKRIPEIEATLPEQKGGFLGFGGESDADYDARLSAAVEGERARFIEELGLDRLREELGEIDGRLDEAYGGGHDDPDDPYAFEPPAGSAPRRSGGGPREDQADLDELVARFPHVSPEVIRQRYYARKGRPAAR